MLITPTAHANPRRKGTRSDHLHPSSAHRTRAGRPVIGIDGHLTYARAVAVNGPPGLRITGLPESVVRETRDRVHAAVLNSGHTWPARTVIVNMLPPSLLRHGIGVDLAVAVAALTATGAVPAGAADGCVFAAGLGLDGSLRPVCGLVPALLAAFRAGCAARSSQRRTRPRPPSFLAWPSRHATTCARSWPACVVNPSRRRQASPQPPPPQLRHPRRAWWRWSATGGGALKCSHRSIRRADDRLNKTISRPGYVLTTVDGVVRL